MKNLALKLLAFQKEVGTVKKDSVNPFFHSKYADINTYIEVVKPILSKHGLVLIQPLTSLSGKPLLSTLVIDSETGEQIQSDAVLPENPDPQKMGATITYFRRYALQSLLCLEAADDDGESVKASVKPVSKPVEDKNELPWGEEIKPHELVKTLGGTCLDCGNGKYKKSAAGNLYCSEKCWLQK